MVIRLQKFLADAGVASRRAGERMIREGQVTVNAQIVRLLGTKVDPAHDQVSVNGLPVRPRRKLYIAMNKPRRCVCTRHDPEQRATIGEFLPEEWAHLFSVGRLDYASEGLVFLTNDGDFCLKLTHPRYGVRKTYHVTVAGRVAPAALARVVKGVYEGGEQLKAERAHLLSANNTRSTVELVLAEGKNREVRRVCEVLGWEVERLQRTQIGPIKLGELRPGRWRTLTEPEIKSLLGKYENQTVAHPGAQRRTRLPQRRSTRARRRI